MARHEDPDADIAGQFTDGGLVADACWRGNASGGGQQRRGAGKQFSPDAARGGSGHAVCHRRYAVCHAGNRFRAGSGQRNAVSRASYGSREQRSVCRAGN